MNLPCSTNQPFLEGLQNYPVGKKKELHKIKTWLVTQPHLPKISDEYIYLFLHANYYHIDRTKNSIDRYFTIKTKYSIIFKGRDVESNKMQTVMELAHIVRLPELTPEGYKVLLYSVRDPDYSKMVFADAVKGFCMYNDCVLSEDGLVEGYVVLFDMKDVALGHLARVSLPALKAFMLYIQEAHPARLKAIHVLNTASYINHVIRIVYPLVRSELLGLIKFHKGNVPEGVPVEILPKEYGGDAPSIKVLDQESKALTQKYKQWLLDTETFQADESKRIKKPTWWGFLSGTNPTPSHEVQKKQFLDNLQID